MDVAKFLLYTMAFVLKRGQTAGRDTTYLRSVRSAVLEESMPALASEAP
jgi:hypothetical protein